LNDGERIGAAGHELKLPGNSQHPLWGENTSGGLKIGEPVVSVEVRSGWPDKKVEFRGEAFQTPFTIKGDPASGEHYKCQRFLERPRIQMMSVKRQKVTVIVGEGKKGFRCRIEERNFDE